MYNLRLRTKTKTKTKDLLPPWLWAEQCKALLEICMFSIIREEIPQIFFKGNNHTAVSDN